MSQHHSINPPLKPHGGRTLHVVAVARISTDNQDERSLDDQDAKLRQYVSDNYSGPVVWKLIASRGSGETLDRAELFELEELIESSTIDLVITEDLARICRRRQASDFCELCVDFDVRLIALNDAVDTANDGWEDIAFISTWHHERSNRDTSARIRRSHRNRFMQGGVVQCTIYGYIKPADCKSDDELRKDPAAEPVYEEWFQKLENGASYAEIADWLNESGVPTGPFSRSRRWTHKSVSRITHNPILKGVRERNNRRSKRVNTTGRRISVNADPSELLQRHCPHLVFIAPERYDRIIQMLKARNRNNARKKVNGIDPRKNVPKKRTRCWPGQHIRCGLCGRPMLFGGHGQVGRLVCQGAKDYLCWMAVTCDAGLAARKLGAALMAEIERLPDFDERHACTVRAELQECHTSIRQRIRDLDQREARLLKERGNVLAAIRTAGDDPILLAELCSVNQELGEVQAERADLQVTLDHSTPELPPIKELKQRARDLFADLAFSSPEFQRDVKVLVPSIKAYPYRLIDDGVPVLRAAVTLDLGGLFSDTHRQSVTLASMQCRLVVDLFEPPQREQYRARIVELRKTHTQRETANLLGIAQSAVEASTAFQRKMDSLQTVDPYVPIREPSQAGK